MQQQAAERKVVLDFSNGGETSTKDRREMWRWFTLAWPALVVVVWNA